MKASRVWDSDSVRDSMFPDMLESLITRVSSFSPKRSFSLCVVSLFCEITLPAVENAREETATTSPPLLTMWRYSSWCQSGDGIDPGETVSY